MLPKNYRADGLFAIVQGNPDVVYRICWHIRHYIPESPFEP